MLQACGKTSPSVAPVRKVWGSQGLRDGAFLRPRAIGAHAGEVYVIDMTGRVQVFDTEGGFVRLWSTPSAENGTPTAIALDGERAIVPDTHYHRILEYTLAGELRSQWGTYGDGPAQFIYPTGVAIEDGEYHICEYGENAERVRVFDAERHHLRGWGTHGAEPGNFNRAMALAVGPDGALYVADTANHRVQCFSREGELLRIIGETGTEPGRLRFPHDIAFAPDGTFFLAEYGNNRVSRFSTDGGFVACYGGPGRRPGLFGAPRGVAVSEAGTVFVADTDNHRVQVLDVKAAA